MQHRMTKYTSFQYQFRIEIISVEKLGNKFSDFFKGVDLHDKKNGLFVLDYSNRKKRIGPLTLKMSNFMGSAIILKLSFKLKLSIVV